MTVAPKIFKLDRKPKQVSIKGLNLYRKSQPLDIIEVILIFQHPKRDKIKTLINADFGGWSLR